MSQKKTKKIKKKIENCGLVNSTDEFAYCFTGVSLKVRTFTVFTHEPDVRLQRKGSSIFPSH